MVIVISYSINAQKLRMEYSTFLGGSSEDRAHGMAVDAQGNIFLTAPVTSTDFPITADALNKTATGIYFAKFNTAGSLVYSTYLGAAGGINYSHGVAVDKEGCIYIAGNTTNPNFPTTPGAFQTNFKGPGDDNHGDAFVIKLNPSGNKIIYSTFLGGTGRDICGKIAVDKDGNAYILGSTSSKDFPVTPGAFQTTFKGEGGADKPSGRGDIFVAKLNPDGSKLVYCTYIGGTGIDIYGNNIILDSFGSVCFTATTTSPEFPITANAFSKTYSGGAGMLGGGDAVIVKLNPTGTALEYASYFGGRGDERGNSVAMDSGGNIWLSGETNSEDFPTTPNAYCRKNNGGSDCFFLKINPLTGKLLYSSMLGGSKTDNYASIAVSPSGLLVIAGQTESANFPITQGADETTLKGQTGLFIALFDPAVNSLRYCTFLGGSGNHVPGPLLVMNDTVYFAGNTTSTDFPVTANAWDKTFNGGTNIFGGDAFVTKFILVNSKVSK
jgi:hypothetical protein